MVRGASEERLRRITESILELPTLPVMVTRMLSLVGNPKTSAADLARLISTDQAMTAKILKLANSAFYGFPRQIATVDLAVVVLGFDTVKDLGLSISVLERLADGDSDDLFDSEGFWEHSIACGVGAKLLAKHLRYRTVGETFVGGILHDIGKLVLSQHFKEAFSEVLQLARREGIFIFEAEEQLLGVTHAEVGGWLAEKWNLPASLVEVIGLHHRPLEAIEDRELCGVVHLADGLCRHERIGITGDAMGPAVEEQMLAYFDNKMSLETVMGLGEELREELKKAEEFVRLIKD